MRRKEINMTSEKMRDNPLFMRNGYDVAGRWEIPVVRKQMVDFENIKLIPCSETRPNDREDKKNCGVHFFVDDYRFNAIYNNPEKSLAKLKAHKVHKCLYVPSSFLGWKHFLKFLFTASVTALFLDWFTLPSVTLYCFELS